jgi:hypothetical protein
MKGKLFTKQVINKVPVQNKAELEEMLEKISDFDLPDELESVLTSFVSLHTEDSAKANKGIAEYHTNKYTESVTKGMVSRLQGEGFDTSEIDEVLRQKFEDRWLTIAQIKVEKERKKYNLSESEQVRMAEEKAAREKDRADRLQQVNIEKEMNLKRQMEEERLDFDLTREISNMPFNDNIRRETAIGIVRDRLKTKLAAANATITRSGDALRLVPIDNPSLDYYDARNTLVNLKDFIQMTMEEENLYRKRENTPKTNMPNTNSRVFNTPSNGQSVNPTVSKTKSLINQLLRK